MLDDAYITVYKRYGRKYSRAGGVLQRGESIWNSFV